MPSARSMVAAESVRCFFFLLFTGRGAGCAVFLSHVRDEVSYPGIRGKEFDLKSPELDYSPPSLSYIILYELLAPSRLL